MRRALQNLTLLLAACACLPAAAVAGETWNETLTATSRQQAEDRDHPSSHLLPLAVTRPFHGGARICGRYENDVYPHGHQGRASLTVELWRNGARVTTVGFGSRRVRANQIEFGCRAAPRLRGGDVLLYDFRFTNMPRLEPRIFSHGGLVYTSMLVTATVEPPQPQAASTIELLGVEPALGSRVPAGGKIRVRIGYTCSQPMGCNVTAAFTDSGNRWVVRGVAPGSRQRTLILRCHESRGDLVMRALTVEIERAPGLTLDFDRAGGAITCVGSGY